MELSPEQYHEFFSSYGKNLYWISLSGGEISLYPNIEKLIAIISKYCPNLCLITFTTNGLLPEKILDLSRVIKKNLPQCDFFVTISLDGDKNLHDALRGIKGNYDLALRTYGILSAEKIGVHFGATLNNSNANYYSGLKYDQLKTKAISIVHSEGIYNQQFQIENEHLLKSLLKIKSLYRIESLGEIVEYIFIKLGVLFLRSDRKKLPIPCSVINTSIHLSPYGEVMPCMYMPALGNIVQNNIDEILRSEKTKDELKNIKNNHCPKCWMNCYAPHSVMRHPIKSLRALIWK